jgi:hypothetical protein
MITSLFGRLTARLRRRSAAVPTALASPLPADPAPAASAAKPEPSPAAAWHLLARRPAIDAAGAIGGWELRLSDWAMHRLARADAPRALQETYRFALVQAARAAADSGRPPLVSAVGIDDIGALLAALPRGTVFLVDDGSGDPAARLIRHADDVQAAGLHAAVPPGLHERLHADYALLDAARLGSAEVLRRCLQPAPAPRGWIAMNLASFDEVAEAVRHRAAFAFGRLSPAGTTASRRSLQPPAAAAQVAAILHALVSGRAPRDLAQMLKGDVALSYRLLRYLSLAGIGQGRRASTIQEAVMLLGNRELHRWLCILLADSGTSPIARALHETALTRGRLLELIAAARSEPNPEALFVLGAFSLLDLLLEVPLEVALALAPLPEPTVDALIAESGPWRPYLDVALALEASDAERLDDACGRLRLAREAVLALHADAGRWSTEAAASLLQASQPARRAEPVGA